MTTVSDSTPSTVGIVGGGTVAQAIARHASERGYDVTISNSRGPETLQDLAGSIGENVTAGTVSNALAASLSILAIPFAGVPQVGELRDDWSGTTLIDATNQFAAPSLDENAERADLGDLTGSE